MHYKNKNVLIIGLSKSGQSSYEFLKSKKANLFLYDKDKELVESLKKIILDAIFVDKIDENLIKNIDLVVISPGVSIYSEAIKMAKLFNKEVIGELQLGLDNVKGNIIAITGTNGKTTTVNLIEQTFNYANKKNILCGNVGNPITKFLSKHKNNYIVEVSSFQLESCNIFPHIACILNLSPNHLDRHFSFEEYIQTKYKIF